MRKALNDRTLEGLKPAGKRYEVHDLHCPGLSVRVSTQGRKTFNLKYRYGVQQKRMSLGVYPRLTLAKAREKAIAALRHLDDGVNPARLKRDPSRTVKGVCASFIEQYAKPRNRNWSETERILQRELVQAHGSRDIREISRADLLEILDAAVARGAAYQANRILANVRKFFNWCLERDIVETNPAAALKAPTKETARERVLNDDEIARLLHACKNEAYPFRHFVPLLLATAQRRGELASMRWSEIDLEAKTWVIPAERAKNGKSHVVPLSDFALDVLADIPRFLNSDLVLTTTRKTPISGFSKMLARLSDEAQTHGWRLHDLRRTAASGMARSGVAPHVIEKVLNHVSGTISGVAAVYNRYGYDAEKRRALESWGAQLEQISSANGR